MPDITMCKNNACPQKALCYRYVAVPSQWQSMAMFQFTLGVGKNAFECNNFVAIKPGDKIVRLVPDHQFKVDPFELPQPPIENVGATASIDQFERLSLQIKQALDSLSDNQVQQLIVLLASRMNSDDCDDLSF